MAVDKICLYCNKVIQRPIKLSNFNWNKRKFCNKKCQNSYGCRWFIGKHLTAEQKRIHSEAAKKFGCGKWMIGRKHSEETKKKMSGRIPWNYRGARSQHYLERRKFQKTMQKIVFERDNYICQLCGKRGVDLQVDHIQSWAEYVELRFDIKNCRTLCKSCHYQITYGRPIPNESMEWGHNLGKARINP